MRIHWTHCWHSGVQTDYCLPVSVYECRIPGVFPDDYDNTVLIEDGIPLIIIPDETLNINENAVDFHEAFTNVYDMITSDY